MRLTLLIFMSALLLACRHTSSNNTLSLRGWYLEDSEYDVVTIFKPDGSFCIDYGNGPETIGTWSKEQDGIYLVEFRSQKMLGRLEGEKFILHNDQNILTYKVKGGYEFPRDSVAIEPSQRERILEAIKFKVEGEELVELMDELSLSGASEGALDYLKSELGVNLSSALFILDWRNFENLSVKIYREDLSNNPIIPIDSVGNLRPLHPWELYVDRRIFSGQSLVKLEHIQRLSLRDDYFLECEFLVPKYASGTFLIGPNNTVFLMQETEDDQRIIELETLFVPENM